MRILVIEDNERLAELLKKGLEEQGYAVDTTPSGREGEELAVRERYDVIILDLMLPDHDGVQVARELRRRKVSTPTLMLTALASTADKVSGLDAGADDYLTKPFDFDELIARVRALLRRGQSSEGASLRFQDIEMDLVRRKVMRDGKRVDLTTKEFALLEYFMRNPERVLTRTNIGERVWDLLFQDESNVIEVYVSRLRSKIDKGFEPKLIHTVVGTGYVLSAERSMVPA
ncbi:MAG: response regulator transcription factor [Phycisphaerae bacterium]|nr:response regulator transcription factor [Phycisphaerae bacterium]